MVSKIKTTKEHLSVLHPLCGKCLERYLPPLSKWLLSEWHKKNTARGATREDAHPYSPACTRNTRNVCHAEIGETAAPPASSALRADRRECASGIWKAELLCLCFPRWHFLVVEMRGKAEGYRMKRRHRDGKTRNGGFGLQHRPTPHPPPACQTSGASVYPDLTVRGGSELCIGRARVFSLTHQHFEHEKLRPREDALRGGGNQIKSSQGRGCFSQDTLDLLSFSRAALSYLVLTRDPQTPASSHSPAGKHSGENE